MFECRLLCGLPAYRPYRRRGSRKRSKQQVKIKHIAAL